MIKLNSKDAKNLVEIKRKIRTEQQLDLNESKYLLYLLERARNTNDSFLPHIGLKYIEISCYRVEHNIHRVYDMLSVVKHELDELGNTDILDTTGLSRSSLEQELLKLQFNGYIQATWVCRTREECEYYYGNLGEVQEFEVKGYILSDIGNEGLLIAHKPEDLEELWKS